MFIRLLKAYISKIEVKVRNLLIHCYPHLLHIDYYKSFLMSLRWYRQYKDIIICKRFSPIQIPPIQLIGTSNSLLVSNPISSRLFSPFWNFVNTGQLFLTIVAMCRYRNRFFPSIRQRVLGEHAVSFQRFFRKW